MKFDRRKNAYVDEQGREIPLDGSSSTTNSGASGTLNGFIQGPAAAYNFLKQRFQDKNSDEAQERRDREMAEVLQREFEELDGIAMTTLEERGGANNNTNPQSWGDGSVAAETKGVERKLARRTSSFMVAVEEAYTVSDAAVARAMQAMEFEMANELLETRRREDGDFTHKEYAASGCRAQVFTASTLLCLIQIGFLVTMIAQDGFAPSSNNPLYGPPAETLVRYGAKYAAFIRYRNQWWRIFSPMALHAGIIHIISNVFIQLRVGGYLERVYGTTKWLIIYILSGCFGSLMSCVFMADTVGVGSSGAILGMLSSWIVWIVFRWKKIPERCRPQRNCQLIVVSVSLITTLCMSFAPFVDWAAHFGGAVQGLLLGIFFLSNELDDKRNMMIARVLSAGTSIAIFIASIYYVAVTLEPDTKYMHDFTESDRKWDEGWGHR